jgi:hypothetical protein
LTAFPFPQWPLLEHLDVGGLREVVWDGLAADEEVAAHLALHALPAGGFVAVSDGPGLKSIARLSHLTSLRVGTDHPNPHAFHGAVSDVLAALLQRDELANAGAGAIADDRNVAPALAHAPQLKQLALYFDSDYPVFSAGGCQRLSQLQRLELSLSPAAASNSNPYEWRRLAADVLELRQLTSLTCSLAEQFSCPGSTVGTLIAGICELQQLRELHITGADLSAAQTHKRLPTLPQTLARLTVLQLRECRLSNAALAEVQLASLKRLSVQDGNLRCDDVKVLAAAVRRSNVLEELDHGGNRTTHQPPPLVHLLAVVSASKVWRVTVSENWDATGAQECTRVAARVDEFNAKHAGSKTCFLA